MEDRPSLTEGIINSNKSDESQSLVQQNSVDSASADNPRDMCEKNEADCQKKMTNSSNILPSLIIRSQKTDCSNEDETNKSLMMIENKKSSIIQHQVSNTTVTTTQKNQFYIISNPYIKPIQSGSSESTNKCSQSTDILKRVTPTKNTPKKKTLPKIVIENVDSNSQNIPPKLLLYNPHNRIAIPINGIASSTPVAREKKSEGASLKNNHSNVLESNKRSNNSVIQESASKKNKNIVDKVTEDPSAKIQVENCKENSNLTEISHATIDTSSSDKTAALNATVNSSTKEGNTTIGSTSSNSSHTTVSESGNSRSTQTISFNKKNNENNTSSISAPTPNFQKTIPVPEKSNTILMSSIGVQTDSDKNSVAKNLKRKATDDISQDATASCSYNQGAPPAKKQKIQSSEEVSDVIIHLDGKSANRIEISNELLKNGQERQIVSQFFEKISSVVIVQPPSTTQSIVKIINKSLRSTNVNSATNETLRTDGDNNISSNNETLLNKDSRQENSKNQEAASSNEPVNSNEKPTNNDSNVNERSMNENLNNTQTLNKSIINEKSNDKSHPTKENSNNTNLNANIKIQRNEPVASTSTAPVETPTVNQNVKSENNFGSSFSPSGFVQYGTRLLNKTDKICFTGEMDEKRQIAIEKLGGQITNDPTDATVLVADKFRRTFKFICAICRSIPIVSTQWINESITKNNFVNPYKYILKDEVAEKTYGFNLEESLMKAKKKQLFQDYTVLITNGVNRPSVNELRTIVKFAGGRPLVRAPKYWGPKSMIISCEDDAPKVRKILEKKPQEILCPVVSADFILSSLLKQDLEINTSNLKVEKK
ncbi:putative uncharacterized protein DDB_G0286901 [Cotesia glomerata]|uniref:putative uncharacterized protein DDB_G0286901 n=1 Tax=Cotesia glomerata TaxID=32391 RepID=UPI001D00BEF9|nr:putative uncharacterized protein DDB_G0286901 [Cotesia glomerata]